MSKERTETHIHLAKDNLFYPSYEEKRDANVRVNNAHLEKIGLGGNSLLKRKAPKKKSKKKSKRSVTPDMSERRLSKRVKKIKPEYDLLPDELDRPNPVKRKKKAPPGSRSAHLEPHELEALKDLPNWLEGMEEFLLTVPHGAGNKVVGTQNARSVMKQTRRLVGGLGIVYHRWEDGVIFKKGVKIDLRTDFDSLYDEAVAFEAQHGKDLGNGWLLRHPIRKIQCYQEYLATTKKPAAQEEKEAETSPNP